MSYIPHQLRRFVWERAHGCCEYCLLGEDDNFLAHEIDHIIAGKHGGESEAENLCLSCFDCNRHKGSDIGSIDPNSGKLTPLFHPRRDQWNAHFRLDGARIEPLSPEGRVTVRLLDLNNDTQVEKRRQLIQLQRYPCE